jgi:hypothetical protein
MDTPIKDGPTTRRLFAWEIEEFRPVFANSLRYEEVRIHELTPFPDRMDHLGRRIKRMPKPGPNSHNAITLGNHCYFPVKLPPNRLQIGHPQSYMLDWLVHELTHAWQYQHEGWQYLWNAIRAQLRDKEKAYDYGGEAGLIEARAQGKSFYDFNPEQQGNITQEYYRRLRNSRDRSVFEPFIEELHRLG